MRRRFPSHRNFTYHPDWSTANAATKRFAKKVSLHLTLFVWLDYNQICSVFDYREWWRSSRCCSLLWIQRLQRRSSAKVDDPGAPLFSSFNVSFLLILFRSFHTVCVIITWSLCVIGIHDSITSTMRANVWYVPYVLSASNIAAFFYSPCIHI